MALTPKNEKHKAKQAIKIRHDQTVSFDWLQMLTNVPPILVRMEPSVPILTETTSVLVTTDLLERTVIKVRFTSIP